MGDSPAVLTTEKKVLTKEQRSEVAREAARRRWAKIKREKGKVAKGKAAAKNAKSAKQKSGRTPQFASALKVAEKQLAKAIQDRQEAANKYAVASATIPSLMRIVSALKNPAGPVPGEPPAVSLEQIVGDGPVPYQNPPRAAVPAIPVPQQLHPANQQGRAQGGAVGGVDLEEEADENQFLRDSPIASGEWH
jgi:hypothetical protein